MDPVRNPFAPGAGSPPPALVGRDPIINAADIALQRILMGRHDKSQIMLGLRGTGKTVLLNRLEQMAQEHDYVTSFIEAPENKRLADLLYPRVFQALRKLSMIESAKEAAYQTSRVLRSFASVFKVKLGNMSLSVDPEKGSADSGNLEFDLTDLFLSLGQAAEAASRGWCLLIDEVQYLDPEEYSALIVAIHRVNQKQLPVIFFGAGLPQVAALSGDAKSYAERLFDFPPLGPLDPVAARGAIAKPIREEGESITPDALDLILDQTQNYPFFLQEWGYQAWNIADNSPIDIEDVKAASLAAQQRLDDGFFKVRLDRLTPMEREYVAAMASLGSGPYRSSDVAEKLGEPMQKLGPRRAKIIAKGMIYSQAHGDIDFTVPMFDAYLRRVMFSSI
ncbi:ATP-binding protein [Hirschia litorea]|uniref:ATP-binding protein n=1 Tax=Hirschia litorea TaxID=1199156 RepID=A0ABW2IQ38_9PROT